MGFGRRQLFKHKHLPGGASGGPYVSPYLLEILSTRPGAPAWVSATGSLVANTGQTISCVRASSAFCLTGNAAVPLVLLGANTVRVEPTGLLVEALKTNVLYYSDLIGNDGAGHGWNLWSWGDGTYPVRTANTTDVTDPTGGNAATKVVFSAVSTAGAQSSIYDSQGFASGLGVASIWGRAPAGQSFTLVFANNGHATTITLTDQWQRFPVSVGFGQVWLENYEGTLGAQPSRTGYFWGCQGEDYFMSSNILTNGAPASRAADSVTVSNPLAALSQPVPTYRMGTWAKPLGIWNYVGTSGLAIFLATGTNGSNNSFRVGIGVGYHTYGGGDLTGNSGGAAGFNIFSPGWADPATTDALTALVMVGNGGVDVTTVPPASSVPVTASAPFNPMDASITLGNPVGFTTYGLQGHMRDIFVDNT